MCPFERRNAIDGIRNAQNTVRLTPALFRTSRSFPPGRPHCHGLWHPTTLGREPPFWRDSVQYSPRMTKPESGPPHHNL